MSLQPNTNPLDYLARCSRLRRRGLGEALVQDLQAAQNEATLADLEEAADELLAEMTRLYEQRRTAEVTVFRYFAAEDQCEHPGAEVRRLNVIQDGQVVGGADVLWCPACAQPVGPPPVEPLLWEGDQACAAVGGRPGMRRRIYAARAFGWQLDYRPDGWLPLGVREGWPREPRWYVLPLGRFGCVTFGRVGTFG